MSQKKVDQYKNQKANRKQTMKKEKRIILLEKIGGCVLCVAILFWAGFSIYKYAGKDTSSTASTTTTSVDMQAISDYYSSLSQ